MPGRRLGFSRPARIELAFGGVDVLVNNAGVLMFVPVAGMPLADFRRLLEVNAVGCRPGMKAVIGPMTKAGGGSIVNVCSVEGFTGAAGWPSRPPESPGFGRTETMDLASETIGFG